MARRKSQKNKTDIITIRVSEEITAMLERLAEDFGLNLSETIRAIVLIVYIMQYIPEDVRKNWDEYVEHIKQLIKLV